MAEIGLAELGTMLIVASLVARLSRCISLPYTAGLVLAGIRLAYVPVGADLPLSRELIGNVLLPPLLLKRRRSCGGHGSERRCRSRRGGFLDLRSGIDDAATASPLGPDCSGRRRTLRRLFLEPAQLATAWTPEGERH